MPTATHTVIVSIFDQQLGAEQAVSDLEKAGFTLDQIGYAARETMTGSDEGMTEGVTEAVGTKDQAGAATGAVTGGVVGGLLGAAAALVIPGIGPVLAAGILASAVGYAAAGVAVGGIIGALTSAGLSEDEAHFYEKEFTRGRAIVTVRSSPRDAEVREIFRNHGGRDLHPAVVTEQLSASESQLSV